MRPRPDGTVRDSRATLNKHSAGPVSPPRAPLAEPVAGIPRRQWQRRYRPATSTHSPSAAERFRRPAACAAPGRTTTNSGSERCIPARSAPGPAQHAGPGQLSRRCWSRPRFTIQARRQPGPPRRRRALPGTSDVGANYLHVVSLACREAGWVSSAGLRRLLRRGPALECPRAARSLRRRRSRLARPHARRASGETASTVRLARPG